MKMKSSLRENDKNEILKDESKKKKQNCLCLKTINYANDKK